MPDHGPAPEVSIIVPIFRQWRYVPGLIAALKAQDLAPDRFEVIFVNNEPNASAQATTLLRNSGFRWLHCAEPGSYAARNAGAASARGQVFLFSDADCLPTRSWARNLLAAVQYQPGCLIAGHVDIPLPKNPNRWQIFDHIRGIPQRLFVAHGYGATANLAVPRDVFKAMGGFESARLSGGDAEFCRRAGRAGHAIHYSASAAVYHPARNSFAALAIKARRVKGGQVASGPISRRVVWTLRSLSPPIREILHYLRTPSPFRLRLTAISVRLQLWCVELAEVARLLLFFAKRERR